MCGICGYCRTEVISKNRLIEMNDTMIHRGPNDSGVWEKQYENFGVGLAHRRLSILDLSAMGHQPMLSNDGKVVVVFNGEIYNYMELRKELINKGYSFKSNCDTEVILAAYQEWDCECFSKFNGMFAIALFEETKKRFVLARDRAGKKPLYYYKCGKEFAFGSELKPIMRYPFFRKEINYDVIGQFMCNKYIVAPQTIFLDTYKVEPGTYVIYENGEIIKRRYWDLLSVCKSREEIDDFGNAKVQLKNLLRDSISKRLISDVPVGTFLSGGIDSTLITAIANEVNGKAIDTFTIGFFDKERDEAPYAAEIAKYLGTNHHQMYMDEDAILEMLLDMPEYFDEPFSDASALPTMLVSKVAADKVTVALSGDGGDELFCGYKMYDWTWIMEHADFLGKLENSMPWNKKLLAYFPPEIRAFVNNRDDNFKCQLYVDVMIEEAKKLLVRDLNQVKFPIEKNIIAENLQEKRMLLDILTYLPNEILTKMDRASMKYSLEARCPLLDYRIMEWSLKIPHEWKYHNFSKKYILKQAAYDYIPEGLLNRPKKGFGVPLKKWLRGVLRKEILKYAEEEKLKKQGIFRPEMIRQLIEKQSKSDKIVYSSLLWSFFVFQSWYYLYIEDI